MKHNIAKDFHRNAMFAVCVNDYIMQTFYDKTEALYFADELSGDRDPDESFEPIRIVNQYGSTMLTL